MRSATAYILLLLIFSGSIFLFHSCHTSSSDQDQNDSLAIRKQYAFSPVLSAAESLKKIHLEKGFAVKLVASEPLVNSPVAMTFDEEGRIWVVEMENYMPDTAGTGEELPAGKIVMLTDRNGDGIMDERQIFLDSLILPRAICLIEDGLLVAEPPNLWYYTIKSNRLVGKTLIDSAYAAGGSVEHQPNGLLRGLDNWIYSAKSSKRYRKKNGRWLIEQTHFRGQWGITQDAYGRLYYNTNSENLLGDYFSPGFGAANGHQEMLAGFNESIVADNRVYPARPNTGVNRGYMQGVLDDCLRLVNFTAACSPAVYGGTLFSNEYYGNIFVAEPSANLIKRNIIQVNSYNVTGRQAYTNREFLASEDERFRPVSLYEGPDGALYVVDMYRGILQHKVFLTGYLKSEIKERALTQPLSCGRIYKIVPENSTAENIKIPKGTNQLLNLLKSKSNWIRNKAQQLIVDGKYRQLAPDLRTLLTKTDQPLTVIHSLWTMEGLDVLQPQDVLLLLAQPDWRIRMQALTVLPSVITKQNADVFLPVLQQMISQSDTLAAPYIAFLVHSVQPLRPTAAKQLLFDLIKKYPRNVYVADAVISNLFDKENNFYAALTAANPDTGLVILARLKTVIADIEKTMLNKNIRQLTKLYPKGAALFTSVCQPCHGAAGNGVRALGPPLNNSDWVAGDKNKLISIVLFGLSGPVTVKGKLYKAPEVSGEMPALGQNKEFTDEDIAQVLNFIRNSWSNKAEKITASDVAANRNKHAGRQKPFTMYELNRLP